MNIAKLFCALLFAFLLTTSPAFADQREEVIAMAEKAAELLKTKKPEKAFEIMQDDYKASSDHSLYVFAFDKNGVIKVHSARPILLGKNVSSMKDVTGYAFMKDMLQVKDRAWITYKWPDATDLDKIKTKSSYVIHIGDYFVTVGYYK